MLGSSLLLALAAALPVHVIASSVAQVGDIAYYVPDKVEVRVFPFHLFTVPLTQEKGGQNFRCQRAASYHSCDFD